MKNHLVYLLFIFTSLARADESRDELIVQTVLKLESFNYDESSDKVKASINRYLNRNLGKGDYFTLVEKFAIKDQLENLTSLSTYSKSCSATCSLVGLLFVLNISLRNRYGIKS